MWYCLISSSALEVLLRHTAQLSGAFPMLCGAGTVKSTHWCFTYCKTEPGPCEKNTSVVLPVWSNFPEEIFFISNVSFFYWNVMERHIFIFIDCALTPTSRNPSSFPTHRLESRQHLSWSTPFSQRSFILFLFHPSLPFLSCPPPLMLTSPSHSIPHITPTCSPRCRGVEAFSLHRDGLGLAPTVTVCDCDLWLTYPGIYGVLGLST